MLPSRLPLTALARLIRDHSTLTASESDECTPLELLAGYFEGGEYGGMPIENPESDETEPLKRLQGGERLAIQLHLGQVENGAAFVDGSQYCVTEDEASEAEGDEEPGSSFPDETGFFGLGIWLDGEQLGLEPVRIAGDLNGNICVTRAVFPKSLVERVNAYLQPLLEGAS
jgi:hypothetical protein